MFARRALLLCHFALTLTTRLVAYDPSTGDFSKAHPSDIRIMAYNTARKFISDSTKDALFQRILQAVKPDIISFEEIEDGITTAQLVTRLNSILPTSSTWTVHLGLSDGYVRTVLASRYPQSMNITDTIPASEVRGVNAGLVNLPDATYPTDIYPMCVHLKAFAGGTNTTRRQKACDALAKWFGDLRTPGGAVDLPTSTPALVMGDFNFVDPDPQQPEVTLRTGDIVDNATYGPDIKGDWDATDLLDVTPADPYTGDTDTYPSGTTNPSSRIDRIYITDSVLGVVHAFVLNTKTMTATQRSGAGLQDGDTDNASDHLPIVADFAVMLPVTLSRWQLE
jgi:endonuclease/exonuclease/phosphatase family metal-dependent hydrolase